VPMVWRYSARLSISLLGNGTSRSSQFFGVNCHSGFDLTRTNCLELMSLQQVWRTSASRIPVMRKKFKENTIAEIACCKKPFQFLRLVYFGLSFHVAGPIALLQQPGNVVRLEELGHHRQFVVGCPGIMLFFVYEKPSEMLQVTAIDFFELALRARLLKLLQSHPVRLIRFHFPASRGAIQIEEFTAGLDQRRFKFLGFLTCLEA
jgi:hypothetical protein